MRMYILEDARAANGDVDQVENLWAARMFCRCLNGINGYSMQDLLDLVQIVDRPALPFR